MISVLYDIELLIAGSIILLGIIQLIYRNSGPLNHCLAISFFSLGYVLLYMRGLQISPATIPSLLANTENPVTFFSAASIYLTVTTIMGERPSLPATYKRHFIIPSIMMVSMIAYNSFELLHTGTTQTPWDYQFRPNTMNLIQIYNLLTDSVLLAYIFVTLRKAIQFWRSGKIVNAGKFRWLFVLLIYLAIMSAVFIITIPFPNPLLMFIVTYLCGFLVMLFGLFGFRYPEYLHRVLKTVSGQNKRKEHLEKRNTHTLMADLVSLMEKERVYRNPALTLEDIGRSMQIPAQMVSQLINRKAGVNFKAFINAYRIQAVCNQLVKNPDTPILEIAFRNGFNSKSAFNTTFQELTGKTPREFRKHMQAGKVQTLKLPSFVKSSVAK